MRLWEKETGNAWKENLSWPSLKIFGIPNTKWSRKISLMFTIRLCRAYKGPTGLIKIVTTAVLGLRLSRVWKSENCFNLVFAAERSRCYLCTPMRANFFPIEPQWQNIPSKLKAQYVLPNPVNAFEPHWIPVTAGDLKWVQ